MSILGTPGSHPLVVQSLSHFWLFVIPWTAAPQASLTFTISSGLLKLTSFELVIPSNHLFLWCPLTHLLILPLIPPGELRPSPEPFWAYFGVPSTCVLSCVWLFATPWTIACQAPLSMGFSRQEYWSGLPVPSPGHPRTPCLSLPGAQDLFPESITWSLWHLSLDLLGPPFCWLETHLNLSPDPVWPTWAFQAVAACQSVGCVRLFVTLWTVARQAPLSMGFSRQEHWVGLPFPSPVDILDPGVELLHWQVGSLPLSHRGTPSLQDLSPNSFWDPWFSFLNPTWLSWDSCLNLPGPWDLRLTFYTESTWES